MDNAVEDEGDNSDIQMEVEVPQGNLYERRDFHEMHRRYQPPPLPISLQECVENGVLHIDRAARLILSEVRRREFNAVYYEFVRFRYCTARQGHLRHIEPPGMIGPAFALADC
ncbi:unnamed protein product [Cylicostephanus goldi]|uniref:Uncharacterized protein n=1 Tax=Cylicostephanus goldi TaxID=71465 RepID=A0A3P7PYG9_CYLGO|nr:unnamed protein product [Cylicostephanus goldi]